MIKHDVKETRQLKTEKLPKSLLPVEKRKYSRTVNSEETNKQNVTSQRSSQISQPSLKSTGLALVISVMLNTFVEDSPSNRLPISTVNPFKYKYIQHITIFNQHSSPFHDSLLTQ